MTKSIIEIAKQSGLVGQHTGLNAIKVQELEAFAALVKAAHLEELAGVNDAKDAERWRYASKTNDDGYLNFMVVYESWDGNGYFVEAIDTAMKENKK